MAQRTKPTVFKRKPRKAVPVPKVTAKDVVEQPKIAAKKIAKKIDPTKKKAGLARKPAIEDLVRRAKGSFAMALLRRFLDAEIMAQAAALAFYAVLSLAPLLLILLWLTAQFVPGTQDAFMQQIALLAGADAERIARTIVTNAQARPEAGSIASWRSIALLFVGATAVFAQLQDVLNKIFRTDATQLPGLMAWLRKRVFSLGLVFALGFLLLVSMTINTVLQFAFARLEWMLPLMASGAAWCVYAVGFALMYHYLPDRSVGWKRALGGGAATALLFVLGRGAIGWYLARADPGSAYGSMGVLVLGLVWIYYAALIVFVGAMATAGVDERAKARATARARQRAG
jgi:membrane protein